MKGISRTVFPPTEQQETKPSEQQYTDEKRKSFFTNWNELLIEKVRDLQPQENNLTI